MITSLQPNITRFNDWVSVSEKLTWNANFFTVKYVNKISYVCLKTKLKTQTKKGFLNQITSESLIKVGEFRIEFKQTQKISQLSAQWTRAQTST